VPRWQRSGSGDKPLLRLDTLEAAARERSTIYIIGSSLTLPYGFHKEYYITLKASVAFGPLAA
jgi:hypothetical protein